MGILFTIGKIVWERKLNIEIWICFLRLGEKIYFIDKIYVTAHNGFINANHSLFPIVRLKSIPISIEIVLKQLHAINLMKYKTITIHSFSGDKNHINEPIYKRGKRNEIERERERVAIVVLSSRNHLGTYKNTHALSIQKSPYWNLESRFVLVLSLHFFLPLTLFRLFFWFEINFQHFRPHQWINSFLKWKLLFMRCFSSFLCVPKFYIYRYVTVFGKVVYIFTANDNSMSWTMSRQNMHWFDNINFNR